MNLHSDTAYMVASHMNYDQLKTFCGSNREFARYCTEPRFQQLKKQASAKTWYNEILNLGPDNGFDFILDGKNHKISIDKYKNNTIDINEVLDGLPFTDSLLYQIFYQPLFKTTPTFDQVLSKKLQTKINILHRDQLQDEILKLLNNIAAQSGIYITPSMLKYVNTNEENRDYTSWELENKQYLRDLLSDIETGKNDSQYSRSTLNIFEELRHLMALHQTPSEVYEFNIAKINSEQLQKLLELMFLHHNIKIKP